MKINVVTVTYGNRFNLLEKTLNSVILDKRVDKIILIDNNSENKKEIDLYINKYPKEKIILIRNKENKGSAGGFKEGIIEARKNKSDYVFLLDDDNVCENNWSDFFYNILDSFSNKNIVLKANRGADLNLSFNINYFSLKKIKNFFSKKQKNKYPSPILEMPNGAIGYGGSLIPYKAILDVDLPFESFYLYADDAEYLFRINSAGYKSYQLTRPYITDIDQTLPITNKYKFLKSFDSNVSLIKLFFMTRNSYALPIMTGTQSRFSLFMNGLVIIPIKIFFAFMKIGINKFTIERSWLIITAFLQGIRLKFDNEKYITKYSK